MNYAPTEDMNGKRKHKSAVLNDFVGAGLALPGSEQGCKHVMAVAHKKGAASGAPTCTQNAANQKRLPEGWVWKTLGEIAEINPRIDKSKIPDDLQVSFVPMPAVGAGDGHIDVSQLRPAKEVRKGYTAFQEGDVLFAKITPCMENGKMVVVPKVCNGYGFGSTEFHVLRPSHSIDARYLYHFVSNTSFRRDAAHSMTGAVGQKRVPTTYLADCSIPLAPLDQQKLIVAEIEKQFSRLDEAVAGLKRIKANLKRYKASVLKAAVEGKLTEEWRSRRGAIHCARSNKTGDNKGVINQAPTEYETGAELLKRILAERKKKWEEKNPGKKYKEPVAPDTSNLPDLAEGWVWATTDQLVAHITDGDHQPPPQTEQGIPFLVIGNVRRGKIDFSDTRFVSDAYYTKLDPYRQPKKGDLLYTLVGSYGIPVLVETDQLFCIQRHMAILRPHERSPMRYLTLAMAADSIFRQATAIATGTAQKTVPLTGLRKIIIPLPPAVEQECIVADVDRRLSIVREIESQVDANLKRAERLRQGILKKAFSGQLSVSCYE